MADVKLPGFPNCISADMQHFLNPLSVTPGEAVFMVLARWHNGYSLNFSVDPVVSELVPSKEPFRI
jgi:hypothetical protein